MVAVGIWSWTLDTFAIPNHFVLNNKIQNSLSIELKQ